MEDTINFATELPLEMIKFGRTVAFPGTEMFNRYHAQGIIQSYNWDDYYTYSNESLFTHSHLSRETVARYTQIAYKRAVLFNPRFIWRRLSYGLRTGSIFWDLFYVLKFLLMPPLSTKVASHYYAKDRWPQYEFRGQMPSRTEYLTVRKSKAAKQELIPSTQAM